MGSVTKMVLYRALRRATANPEIWTDERLETVWDQFDQGTQRAILRLHRAGGPEQLAAAGLDLEQLDMPTLVVWGEQDPWFEPEYAEAYGQRLPRATVTRLPEAGHWPWLERQEVAEQIVAFLDAD